MTRSRSLLRPALALLCILAQPFGAAADELPPDILGSAGRLISLGDASPTPGATTRGVGPVGHCLIGYVPPVTLLQAEPAAQPSSGGIFYSLEELGRWRERIANGPFVNADDFARGSPGDWGRIAFRARAFLKEGESDVVKGMPLANYGTYGTMARDAAFFSLIKADTATLAEVRNYLVAQTKNPAVDFPSVHCLKNLDGTVLDGLLFEGSWLLRYVVSYDYVRRSLDETDRLTIENFIRRNAYYLATMNDSALASVFPKRMVGDYSVRATAARPGTDNQTWASRRFDTNGDCKIDETDSPEALPIYAYVLGNGKRGPRLSVLSLYYNNRRSGAALAYGAAGILLADPSLIASAKRYFMEWLAYGVYPDGSQGEYNRNGNYCIAGQGPIYAASNLQGAAMFAGLLARQGDHSLAQFSTREGLFGTQSPAPAAPKTLSLALNTYLELITGHLEWYYDQPWRSSVDIQATNELGAREVHYMRGKEASDEFHELGLLPLAALFPDLPIAGVVERDRAVTALRFPGSTGNGVATGLGAWTDVFNALPAAFLLSP